MPSAHTNPGPVEAYLEAELAANRICELKGGVSQLVVINRFGVIPKRSQGQ